MKNLLIGNWEIRSQVGGMKGSIKTFPKGNGNIVQFSQSEFKHLYNNKILDKGKFTLVQKKSRHTGQAETFIQYQPGNIPLQYLRIRADSLFMNTDSDDGIQYIYVRVNPH